MTGDIQLTSSTGQCLSDHPLDLLAIKEQEPHIDPSTGEWLLSEYDIECIAVGSGIMGCGGGGSPHIGRARVLREIRAGQKIRVITPEKSVFSFLSVTVLK